MKGQKNKTIPAEEGKAFFSRSLLVLQKVPEFEQVARQAKNLDALLESPTLLDNYFEALVSYYGPGRFTRQSFDVILKQLIEIKDKVPGFKERLWETTHLGESFSLSTQSKMYGRNLDKEQWDLFFNRWKKSLRIEAALLFELADAARIRKIEHILKNVERLTSYDLNEDESAHNQRTWKNYKRLNENSDIVALSAYTLYHELQHSSIRPLFESGDPDIILNSLNYLRLNQKDVLATTHLNMKPISSFISRRIPHLRELLFQQNLFPIAHLSTRNGQKIPFGQLQISTYYFSPILRRLHGIWKGATVEDCVGGALKYIDKTTPERWAVSALDSTQVHYIKKYTAGAERGEYVGYIQLVPMVNKLSGEVIATAEFMNTVMLQKILVDDPFHHKRTLSTLFEFWCNEINRRIPQHWEGVAVSESNAFNHYGTLAFLRYLPTYLCGTRKAAKDFEHTDPMSQEIVKASKAYPKTLEFAGNMITVGTVPDAVALTVLKPYISDNSSSSNLLLFLSKQMQAEDTLLRWRAAIALVHRNTEDLEAFLELLKLFEKALQNPLQRIYEPFAGLFLRKFAQLRKKPPHRWKTSELWADTVITIAAWLRQNESLYTSESKRDALSLYAIKLLRKAVFSGRDQNVQSVAARTLGGLKVKDSETIAILCRSVKRKGTYRGRIMQRTLRNAAVEALGMIGLDTPQVNRVLSLITQEKGTEVIDTKTLTLEALKRIKGKNLDLSVNTSKKVA